MDMTYLVAPCYTREGSIGIGGAATALYRIDRTDSVKPPSDLQLTGSATIKGFYTIGLKGNTYLKGNRSFLKYSATFTRKTLYFWGIDYKACTTNPVSEYERQQIKVDADFIYKIFPQIRIGAGMIINHTEASKLLNPDYLDGQKNGYFLSGISGTLQYDARDFSLNPKRGIYVMLKGTLYHKFTGVSTGLLSPRLFNSTHFIICGRMLYWDMMSSDSSTVREHLGLCAKNWVAEHAE